MSFSVELIANILGLIGSLFMVLMGCLKKKKDILLVQNIQLLILGLSNLIVGGFIGAVVNVIGIFRNILCSKNKLSLFWIIVITIITIMLGLLAERGSLSLVRYLPILAALIFLFFINIKDMIKFKLMSAIVMFLWFIYDLELMLYTTALFDFITFLSCLVVLFKLMKGKKKIKKK